MTGDYYMERKFEIWLAEDDLDDFELFKEVLLTSPRDIKFLHFKSSGDLFENLMERKKRFEQTLPNLIVLDQSAPEKDGWEILEVIKSDAELRNIVVIMMSGNYTQENIERGYRMGMDGYIQKPVFIGEWKSIIDKLILTWNPEGK